MKKALLWFLAVFLLWSQPGLCLNSTSILGLQELLEEGEAESVVTVADAMLGALRPEPPAGSRWLCFAMDGYRFLYEALHPTESFDIIDYDVVNVLYLKAYAHFELGQYPEAIQALTEGLGWDPIGLQLRFELLHNYRQLGMRDQLQEAQRTLFTLLLYPEDFAQFYRFIGSALVDDGEWEAARAYLLFSLRFEDGAAARNELSYIDEQLQEDLLESLNDAETKESLLSEAEAQVAADGWGFSLSSPQRAALQRQMEQEGSNGTAAQSLALYNSLLPILPPQAKL